MMTSVTAFPLCWPPNFPRAKSRERGTFRTSLAAALANVERSLISFGRDSRKPITGIILSSNCSLGFSKPSDPGIAVWFVWDGLQVCLPVDRYLSPEANLQAVHHIIEARRVELRHGTFALVRATMTGFAALPPPDKPWWEVLGVPQDACRESIIHMYKLLAQQRHPDKGGSAAAMLELNAARDAALKEFA